MAETDGVVARVVGWLRAGYPAGVPEQDYVPLLGVLRRSLTADELELVVAQLVEDAERAEQFGGSTPQHRLRERVEQLLLGPALPEDLIRVSTRLASAGWPLGAPVPEQDPQRPGLVARAVSWLRAGYPTGPPERDFVPLVALLRRRLTDEEIVTVCDRLTLEGMPSASRIDVGTAIAQLTSELPSDEDIERVQLVLAADGRDAGLVD